MRSPPITKGSEVFSSSGTPWTFNSALKTNESFSTSVVYPLVGYAVVVFVGDSRVGVGDGGHGQHVPRTQINGTGPSNCGVAV